MPLEAATEKITLNSRGSGENVQLLTEGEGLANWTVTGYRSLPDRCCKWGRIKRLKDYTNDLAKKHALQGYNGITISKERMQEKVKERVGSHIQIDM